VSEPDYMRIYRRHWKRLVETDGKLDLDKVARELSDYHGMLEEVPKVYDHVTGGLLSKPNYHARSVIGAADEHLNRMVDEAVKEAREEWEAGAQPEAGEPKETK
jgi:hypothetical protein